MRAVLSLLLLLLASLSVAQAGQLRIALGVQNAVSQSSVHGKGGSQSGGLTALNEDLAREICRRINVRCVTLHVLFGEILPGVEGGKFDFGFGNFLRTPEREKHVAFSDVLWRSSSRLLAAPQTAQRFAARLGREPELAGLRRARIGVVAETQQHLYLKTIAEGQELTVLTATTMGGAVALLREGKVDFCLLPMLSAYAMLSFEPAGTFEFVGRPLTESGLGGTVHIALPKTNLGLREGVNQAIAAMRTDGTYHRIVRRHFPFNLD